MIFDFITGKVSQLLMIIAVMATVPLPCWVTVVREPVDGLKETMPAGNALQVTPPISQTNLTNKPQFCT